jgi:hypothetical protein
VGDPDQHGFIEITVLEIFDLGLNKTVVMTIVEFPMAGQVVPVERYLDRLSGLLALHLRWPYGPTGQEVRVLDDQFA